MHVAETLSNKRPYHLESATLKVNGKDKRVKFLEYDTDSEIFSLIGAEYEKTHEVKTLSLGNATCKLIDMSSLHEFTLKYFKEHL
jgi:aminoglycoside N3'-acetyltransferase